MFAIIGIDIGNSYSKINLNNQTFNFSNHAILNNLISLNSTAISQTLTAKKYQLSVSSVVKPDTTSTLLEKITNQLQIKNVRTRIWTTAEILELAQIRNRGELAHLGSDRALRIYYLNQLSSTNIQISCGCGSAFTVEVIQNGSLIESHILPGLAMQLTSLNEKTARLPLIDPKNILQLLEDNKKFSTVYSIITGVLKSYLALIGNLLDQYQPEQLLLSGGYADLLKTRYPTENRIYATHNLEAKMLVELAIHNMQMSG